MPDTPNWKQQVKDRAADRLNAAADALVEDAQRADLPSTVAERKRAAANDLRTYGEQIRTGERRLDSAEVDTMVTAGQCSGIVIDGWRNVEAQLQQSDSWTSPEAKEQIRANYDAERAVRDKLVVDGHMVRVAEDGQVPFYALASYGGWTREEVAERNASDVDEA